MAQQGARIIAVTDWKGGVFNPKGLDVDALIEHVTQHKTVNGYRDAEPLTQPDVFTTDAEILITRRPRSAELAVWRVAGHPPAVDWFRVVNGQIVEARPYFDPTPLTAPQPAVSSGAKV